MDLQIKNQKRIHIIGSIGSGKTTLAKKLSDQLNIPYFELDNVVWERFTTGDIKRTEEDRDAYLGEIIASKEWIVEGVHHKWVTPCFQHADLIIFLDIKHSTRRFRIIKRYFMQKAGIEKANYTPTLSLLKELYTYNTVYEYEIKPEIVDMLIPYKKKLIILKRSTEISNALNELAPK